MLSETEVELNRRAAHQKIMDVDKAIIDLKMELDFAIYRYILCLVLLKYSDDEIFHQIFHWYYPYLGSEAYMSGYVYRTIREAKNQSDEDASKQVCIEWRGLGEWQSKESEP